MLFEITYGVVLWFLIREILAAWSIRQERQYVQRLQKEASDMIERVEKIKRVK